MDDDRGFSYPEVGATREQALPDGYHHVTHRIRLDIPFALAAETVLSWEMHRRCGLRPKASAPRAAEGVEVVCRFGPLSVPCRVVWAVEGPKRAGFAYGTLPGHPECGEESFVVEVADDGSVWFEVRAFSRPGRWFTRLAGPLGRWVQQWMTRRYAKAVARG